MMINPTQKILLSADVIYSDKTVRGSKFYSLIDNKKIYAAEPMVSASSRSDRKVRFWVPYLSVTAGEDEQETKILWSYQLLTLALMEGGENELENIKAEILNGHENEFTLHCKSGRNFVFYRERLLDDNPIRDTKSFQYNRIQYVFKPQTVSDKKFIIDKELVGHWRNDGLDNDIDFKNKVVIIGREDKECRDELSTLIGRMPGMYVHGNAIATVLGDTQPHISPLWKCILIEIILIIVTAYVFIYLKYAGAKRLTLGLTLVCEFGAYIYFWWTNEFVYLTCSFASLGVYNFVSRMEQFFKRGIKIKGWFRKRLQKGSVDLKK